MASIGAADILEIVEYLAEMKTPCSLTNIASHLGMAKSSCLRLLKILMEKQYVELNDEGRYLLIRLPGSGGIAQEHIELIKIAEPIMKWASEITGVSAFLAVEAPNGNLKYISKIVPENQEVVYNRDISRLRNMSQVTSGLCLLAYRTNTDGVDPKTLIDIRQRGFAVNLQGTVEGASGTAAPIFNVYGQAIAAFNLAGPRFNFEESLEKIKETVVEGAARITQMIAINSIQ